MHQDELVRRGDAARPAILKALQARSLPEARETWLLWTLGRGNAKDASTDTILLQWLQEPATGLNRRIQCVRILADRTRRRGDEALAEAVLYTCLEMGLSLKVTMGRVLTLSPPLVITRAELDHALTILATALGAHLGP